MVDLQTNIYFRIDAIASEMLEYVRSWHKGMRMENVNLVGGPGCPRGIWYGYDNG